MIEVEGEDVNSRNAQFPARFIDMLGDSGLQGHFSPPSLHRKHIKVHGIVKMANGEIVNTC